MFVQLFSSNHFAFILSPTECIFSESNLSRNRSRKRNTSALALKSYRDEFSCFKCLQRSTHTHTHIARPNEKGKNYVRRKEAKRKTKHKKKSKHNKTIGQRRERERATGKRKKRGDELGRVEYEPATERRKTKSPCFFRSSLHFALGCNL